MVKNCRRNPFRYKLFIPFTFQQQIFQSLWLSRTGAEMSSCFSAFRNAEPASLVTYLSGSAFSVVGGFCGVGSTGPPLPSFHSAVLDVSPIPSPLGLLCMASSTAFKATGSVFCGRWMWYELPVRANGLSAPAFTGDAGGAKSLGVVGTCSCGVRGWRP